MAACSAASAACSAGTAPVVAIMPAYPQPPSAVTCVASEAAMLANSWASAGGTVTSLCTRSAADARSAARSPVTVTVLGRGDGLAAAPDRDDGDADAPGGTTSLALSCTRCCS